MFPYQSEKNLETRDQTNNENYELESIKHIDCLGGVSGETFVY